MSVHYSKAFQLSGQYCGKPLLSATIWLCVHRCHFTVSTRSFLWTFSDDINVSELSSIWDGVSVSGNMFCVSNESVLKIFYWRNWCKVSQTEKTSHVVITKSKTTLYGDMGLYKYPWKKLLWMPLCMFAGTNAKNNWNASSLGLGLNTRTPRTGWVCDQFNKFVLYILI